MTAILQQLVAEAQAAADPATPWVMEGGRSCPIGWDDCSQPVFRVAGTEHYDYGEPGGPGAENCRTECPHRMDGVPDWLEGVELYEAMFELQDIQRSRPPAMSAPRP